MNSRVGGGGGGGGGGGVVSGDGRQVENVGSQGHQKVPATVTCVGP